MSVVGPRPLLVQYLPLYNEHQARRHNLCLRPSCYQCHSKGNFRKSDITLGDFWGVEKVCSEMYNEKGTSLILINSEKGKKIFGKIKRNLKIKEINIEEAIKYNESIYKSAFENKKREKFMSEIDKKNNKDLTELFTRVGRIQFIILALIFGGFCVVGRYFIEIWAGKNYRTAYIVALILIAPVTVPLIQNLGIEIQRAKNMHKFRSIVYFLIAIFNVIISIPLAKSYGEVGAALGTMITMTIGNIILMNWYYQAKIKLNIIYFWKNIFELIPAVGISIVIAYICKKYIIVNNIGSFLIVGIIYVTVYAVCMFSFGMNKYEKELVKKPIKRLLRKR